jgi:hypothetical protein
MDDIAKLALLLHHNPRSYALMIGSGVSRGAHIPTGWDITMKLCAAEELFHEQKRTLNETLDDWYWRIFQKKPDYADFLAKHFDTQHERQQFLEQQLTKVTTPYGIIESAKPSQAHHKIAELVELGLIKVIITTNFDRLLEDAITSRGIPTNVITHGAAIARQQSYKHADVTIIKIHGDYKEVSTLNTPQELSEYDGNMRDLLIDILKDYGCITCGWSSIYDKALRTLFADTKNTRFPRFYLHLPDKEYMKPEELSTTISNTLNAKPLQISNADTLFTDLVDKILALRQIDEQKLSHEMLLNQLRQHLDQRHFSQAFRLFSTQFDYCLAKLNTCQKDVQISPMGKSTNDVQGINGYLQEYVELLTPLLQHVRAYIAWAPVEESMRIIRLLPKLIFPINSISAQFNKGQHPYFPSYLYIHTIIVTALIENKPDLIKQLFVTLDSTNHNEQYERPRYFRDMLDSKIVYDYVTQQTTALYSDAYTLEHCKFLSQKALFCFCLYICSRHKYYFHFDGLSQIVIICNSRATKTIQTHSLSELLNIAPNELDEIVLKFINNVYINACNYDIYDIKHSYYNNF